MQTQLLPQSSHTAPGQHHPCNMRIGHLCQQHPYPPSLYPMIAQPRRQISLATQSTSTKYTHSVSSRNCLSVALTSSLPCAAALQPSQLHCTRISALPHIEPLALQCTLHQDWRCAAKSKRSGLRLGSNPCCAALLVKPLTCPSRPGSLRSSCLLSQARCR